MTFRAFPSPRVVPTLSAPLGGDWAGWGVSSHCPKAQLTIHHSLHLDRAALGSLTLGTLPRPRR